MMSHGRNKLYKTSNILKDFLFPRVRISIIFCNCQYKEMSFIV